MTQNKIKKIKSRIANILNQYANVAPSRSWQLLPVKINSLQGKLYEAHVLATICKNLVIKEGLKVKLVNGTNLILKQKGGPINRNYPYFEVYDKNGMFGELFTDIEFLTLSYDLKYQHIPKLKPQYADYHELDIALLKPNCNGRPLHSEIYIAAECKNVSFNKKSTIREILGYRRELSFYTKLPINTHFSSWPINYINANPSSVHIFYSSNNNIIHYRQNCKQFGILLEHHNM